MIKAWSACRRRTISTRLQKCGIDASLSSQKPITSHVSKGRHTHVSWTSVPSKKMRRLFSDLLFSSSLSSAEFSSIPSDSIESHSTTYACAGVVLALLGCGVSDACGPAGKGWVSAGRMGCVPGSPTGSSGESGGAAPGDRSSSSPGKAGSRRGDTSPRLVDRTGGDLLPEIYQNTQNFVNKMRENSLQNSDVAIFTFDILQVSVTLSKGKRGFDVTFFDFSIRVMSPLK